MDGRDSRIEKEASGGPVEELTSALGNLSLGALPVNSSSVTDSQTSNALNYNYYTLCAAEFSTLFDSFFHEIRNSPDRQKVPQYFYDLFAALECSERSIKAAKDGLTKYLNIVVPCGALKINEIGEMMHVSLLAFSLVYEKSPDRQAFIKKVLVTRNIDLSVFQKNQRKMRDTVSRYY
jgi:hypothetical protein